MVRALSAFTLVSVVSIAIGAAQAPDLPQAETFLREARDTFTRSQEVWHRYAYKERSTELHMNPFGRMGTGGVRVFEVRPSPIPKLTYRRMVERNGIRLSQEEIARQDAEYLARVSRIEQRATEDAAARRERNRGEDLLAKKRAQMIVEDVVDTLRFEVARREFRQGRPVIVVSFAAKPDARPLTKEGRLARAFRGHLWIDEASREITDVTAMAIDDVVFGGFIAKIYQGTNAVAERRQIDPGVWMPTRLTLSGDVRALFRKARIDHVVEWFDYQRMP